MRYFLFVALGIAWSACAPGEKASAPVAVSAPRDAASRLVGTWSLVSFKNTVDGATVYPMGEDAAGRIVYGASGKMAVVLMRLGREASGDPGFFAYSGGYRVNEEDETVAHHIEACIAPDWLGTDRVRKFEFLDDDRIALRPVEGASELIWQRER
jgi:Lipocalin-like domain